MNGNLKLDADATPLVAILGGGVCLALLAGLGSVAVALLKGKKLLADGTVSVDGLTPADPASLAAAADLDLDTYALARMVEAEAGGIGQSGKLGVAFAAVNHAEIAGKTIAALLVRSTGAGNGYFGRQDQGRYATTSRDPSAAALDAATQVTSRAVADPTGGADQWDSPWSYKDDPVTGETGTAKAARVAAARVAAGKELVTLADVPARKLRFWRTPGGGAGDVS